MTEAAQGGTFCTGCGAEAPTSAQFCYGCGAPIYRPDTESPKPPAIAPAQPTTLKCPDCGLINPASAQRCDCGHDFVNGTAKVSIPKKQAPAPLRGVRGWLLLFCAIATVVAPLFVLLEAAVKGVTPLVLANLGVCALSVYAGIRLWRIAPNALRWAKAYFAVQLGLGILGLMGALLAGSDPAAAGRVSWVIVWALYFHKSVRVRLTYGANL